MRNFKDFWKTLFVNQRDYVSVQDDVTASNNFMLSIFTPILALVFGVLFIMSFYDPNMKLAKPVYGIFALVNITLIVVTYLFLRGNKHPVWTRTLMHCFMFACYGFGIAMGCYVNPTLPTVGFLVLLYAAPLVFTEKPVYFTASILTAITAYLVCAALTQTNEMFMFNLLDIVIYGLLSIVVSVLMASIKIQKLLLAKKSQILAKQDQLTGLWNRHTYDEIIRDMEQMKGEDLFTLISFDVNGLKRVNDTYGHAVGDQLLLNSASCITSVFASYGKVCRIGGDEFAVIAKGTLLPMTELVEKMNKLCSTKSGEYGDSLSISVGWATTGETDDTNELIRLADQRMYDVKAKYYQEMNHDRRAS